jgi:outer membrane protein
MRLRTLLGLALCAAVSASAQTTNSAANTRLLSLRACIDLALNHNLNVRIEHFTVAIAGDQVSSAYGAYDPVFSFNAKHSYTTNLGNFDPLKFNPYFPADVSGDTLGSDLSGKIPFGFSYDFGSSVSRKAAITDFQTDPNVAALYPFGVRSTNEYNAKAGVAMRQHFLKDFWIDYDREVLLARRTELKISQQALRFQIMTTLLAVETAYDDLVDSREEIVVQEQALALRRQFVAETARRVQVGELPPLDDAQAQTQLQNTLTALAAAREVFAGRQNTLIGLLSDDYKEWLDADVQPTDALQALPVEVNRLRSFQSALTNRPDLIEARLAVEKTGIMVKFRFNQIFPSLDLVGGYAGLGNTISSGGGALNQAVSFSSPEYSYGVVVSFPLDNLSARANYRASKAAKNIAELQLQKAEQEVLLAVSDLVNRAGYRFTQVASTHQARIYAEEALNAETKKFNVGFSTSYMVLQYQEILTAARTAEIRAQVDYNKILAQLAFAEGTVLERHHLSLEVK